MRPKERHCRNESDTILRKSGYETKIITFPRSNQANRANKKDYPQIGPNVGPEYSGSNTLVYFAKGVAMINDFYDEGEYSRTMGKAYRKQAYEQSQIAADYCKEQEEKYIKDAWTVAKTFIALFTIGLVCLLLCVESRASEIAILTVAYEASSQSFEGQVAVASVIKTRMAETGKTAEQVVLKPKQFSCWSNGKPTQSRKLSQREIDQARKAWESARPGSYNHYARHDCKPYWIKSAKLSERICDHVFYRL